MSDNGNSPAYPIPPVLHESGPDSYWSQHPEGGLTKREAFAMAAMRGMCAAANPLQVATLTTDIARCAVEQADALLAALDGNRAKPAPREA